MKTEKCKNCTYYVAYYEQFSSGYARLNHGFCQKHSRPQKQADTCETFKSSEQKEKRREERRFDYLEQALTSINEIAQILKEKQDN